MFSHQTMIRISGGIWFVIGLFLMVLGLGFLQESITVGGDLMTLLMPYMGRADYVAIFLMAFGLLLGNTKGRFVMSKAARKNVERIRSLPEPQSFKGLFTPRYILLVMVMMGIGMGMRSIGLAKDVRGLVDIAVGAALIQGATVYFRMIR